MENHLVNVVSFVGYLSRNTCRNSKRVNVHDLPLVKYQSQHVFDIYFKAKWRFIALLSKICRHKCTYECTPPNRI